MPKLAALTLPEWAFLDDDYPGGYKLDGRTVVLHVRTATVLEIFHGDGFLLNDDITRCVFDYAGYHGVPEVITIAVHHSATLDARADAELIKEKVIVPCMEWYSEYLYNEDKVAIEEEKARLN